MSDQDARAALEEAARLYEEYRRTYGVGSPTGADTAVQGHNALQRTFEAIGRPAGAVVGGALHVAEAPARAVAAIGTNLSGVGPHINVADAALYGRDMETGREPVRYGDVLAGTMEDSGEIAPGGKASAIIRAAGNLVTDPGAAPLMMSAAEGAGALAGRFGGVGGTARPTGARPRPRSRLHPQYAPEGGGVTQPQPPERPLPVTATQPVRTLRPTDTQSIKPLQQNQPFGKHHKVPKLQEG